MEQLNSDDSQQVAEATEALIFLDAYIHAAFDGNTKHMHAACIKVSKEQTKEFYNARNAAQRDVLNNITPSQLEKIPEAVLANTFTIGDLVADYRKVKRTLKRRGISVNAPVPAAAEATVPPVRQCTLEEIAEAQRRLEKK